MQARQNKSLENYWSPIKFIINLEILPLGVTAWMPSEDTLRGIINDILDVGVREVINELDIAIFDEDQ
jgi:hypothetical protein